MKIKRVWAMPNKWTFKIPPIAELISRYNKTGLGWVDPFAGESDLAQFSNDITPNKAKFNMDALDFLKSLEDNMARGVFFDPPYSEEQCLRSYKAKFKGTAGRDNAYGWGLINASSAIGASLPTAASWADTDGDTVPDTPSDTFDDYATEHIVYIVNAGLLPSYNYRAAYYDGEGNKRDTQNDTSDASGNLTTQHTFIDGVDAAGTWNVIVCDQAHTPPSTYSSVLNETYPGLSLNT